MGVLTLLKHLAPCLEDSHVERYSGKTIAIDGNTFLFRGCYSCSEQVATGQACTGPVDYLLKRVRMLKHYGVKPWVVLDGRRTPMKDNTNKQRRTDRENNLRMANDLRRQADDNSGAERDALLQKAQTFFQKSIYVTRQMVTNAMAALKKEDVQCMVAPYEADAQVAFLAKCGLASAVITEDSDILVYMAAVKSTASVLYKMDEFGKCKELCFDAEKLSSLPGTIGKFGRGLAAFAGEGGGRLFAQLAVLAGCDYVDNVRGLGLLSALPIVSRFKSIQADRRISRILMHIQKMGKTIPEGHRERMLLAELSFFWHRVYDPRSKTCVHFCSAAPELVGTEEVPALSSASGGTAFLGEHIGDDMVVRLSQGKVDPITGEAVRPEAFPAPTGSGARRSMTQPASTGTRGQPSLAARTKNATLPMTTPGRVWNQQQQQQQQQGERKADRGQPLPPRLQKRPQGSKEVLLKTPRKRHGGLLAEMFERATSKAGAEKENSDPSRLASLQDVSEIVLACGPGRTPTRGREGSPEMPPPTATLNPFAKKPEKTAEAVNSPTNFLTPPTVSVPVSSQCGVALPTGPGRAVGCADAWTRLGNGCLDGARGGEDSPGRQDIVAQKRPGGEQPGSGGGGDVEVVYVVTACAAQRSVNPAGKRAVSTLAPGGARSDRGTGKKAKIGVDKTNNNRPPPGGKGVTMLSFFGRAVARPKP